MKGWIFCVVLIPGFWAWANQAPRASVALIYAEPAKPVEVLLSAEDPDGDPLSFELLEGPKVGELLGTPPRLTYIPRGEGTERLTFRVADPFGAFDIGFVEIRVSAQVTALRVLPQTASDSLSAGLAEFLVAQGVKTLFVVNVDPRAFPPAILPFVFIRAGSEGSVFLVGPAEAPEVRPLGQPRNHTVWADLRRAPPGTYLFLVISGQEAFAYPFRIAQPVPNRIVAHAG
ncbi:MAG: Ig-like domain-containing protein [Candidatus Bipolaricaulaceae bacterium]